MGQSEQSVKTTFEEVAGGRAEVVIDAARISDYAVPARLFGKFSEVLGTNVYHGLWAQELENPSLEPVDECRMSGRYELKELADLKGLTHEELLRPGDEERLGYSWFAWGGEPAPGLRLLRGDAFNSKYSQKIEARAPLTGIRQPVWLPLHRQCEFEVSLYVRHATASIIVCLTPLRVPERVLGELRWAAPPASEEWVKLSGRIRVAENDHAPLNGLWFQLGLAEAGSVEVDQVTLWPADHRDGFDPDAVAALGQEGVSLLRFPGGNYVSGYHWKDDLAPPEKRPTRPNPAWNVCDPHHVGTDEHMRLCRLLGAEPMICVNAGNGTPAEAADWVQYCNGDASTRWGAERARRGHPEPYNVRVWEVGNELWGPWQVGHCDASAYARRYEAFSKAMLAADPTIHLVACGHLGWIQPGWNDELLERCGSSVKSLAYHFLLYTEPTASPLSTFQSEMGYSYLFEQLFRNTVNEGRRHGAELKLAVTELMSLPGERSWMARPNTLTEALFFAGTLNSAIRTEGLVELITHSAALNHGGGLRKEQGHVFRDPVSYARGELKSLAGGRPLSARVACRFADVPEWKEFLDGSRLQRYPLLDALALQREGLLDVVLINRDPEGKMPVRIALEHFKPEASARLWQLTGDTFNSRNDLLQPGRVQPRESVIRVRKGGFSVTLPPVSLTRLTLREQ